MEASDWTHFVLRTFEPFVATLGQVLPKVVAALALLALGLLLAHLLRGAVLRISHDLERLLGRVFGLRFSAGFVRLPWPLSRVLGVATYWLVLLFSITASAEILGFPGMAGWIGRFASYLPVLLSAAAVVIFGLAAAALARDAIAALPLREAELLGRTSYLLIVTIALIIGIGQLGIEVALLGNVVTIAAAAVLGSIALAFGLGARATVGNIIAGQHVKNAYSLGQRIRIEGIEGEIIEITPTAVVLAASDGRVSVPSSRFESAITTVLVDGGRTLA